jgi:hypothetical protein
MPELTNVMRQCTQRCTELQKLPLIFLIEMMTQNCVYFCIDLWMNENMYMSQYILGGYVCVHARARAYAAASDWPRLSACITASVYRLCYTARLRD